MWAQLRNVAPQMKGSDTSEESFYFQAPGFLDSVVAKGERLRGELRKALEGNAHVVEVGLSHLALLTPWLADHLAQSTSILVCLCSNGSG